MPATMKQIADRLGVSVMTVSKALNDRGSLSDATRARVRDAARKMGYRPNAAARAVVTGRFNCAALMLDSDPKRDHLPVDLLYGIHDELSQNGMQLTFTRLSDDQLTSEQRLPMILRQVMADGLLINYKVGVPRQLNDLVRRHNIPSIWIESSLEADCVYHDHLAAARTGTEYLLAMGHRRIAFADSHRLSPGLEEGLRHTSLDDRREGYRQAMLAAGLTPRLIHREDDAPAIHDRVAWAKSWLNRPASHRPTAVITYVMATAQPIIWAAQSLGMRIPEDISVLPFGERREIMAVPLTRMEMQEQAMGHAAVCMLMEKIASPGKLLKPRAIPVQLIEGVSCAPPASPGRAGRGS